MHQKLLLDNHIQCKFTLQKGMHNSYTNCDIAIVNFYFILKWDYILLPKPNAISIANTDYYVFLCQNCTKSSKEQIKEAYTVITKRACT
jgi:hypothetical protein